MTDETHPGQTEKRTAYCETLQDAYLQAQRWMDQGRDGIAFRQLKTGGWYISWGPVPRPKIQVRAA